MYYVLFHYNEGRQELGVQRCNHESDVIEFLHEQYKKIDVHRIIEVKAEYRLGLVVTEELVKSVLEPVKETESLVPLERKPEEIIKENKEKLEEIEATESAEEEQEEELTDEKKVEKQIDEADLLIEREKLRQEQKKKGWKLCTKCNSNRVAPWNKKKICSPCQRPEGTRPYKSRDKEFAGLD